MFVYPPVLNGIDGVVGNPSVGFFGVGVVHHDGNPVVPECGHPLLPAAVGVVHPLLLEGVGVVHPLPLAGVGVVHPFPPAGVGVVHEGTVVVLLTQLPQHFPGRGGSNSKSSGQDPKMVS